MYSLIGILPLNESHLSAADGQMLFDFAVSLEETGHEGSVNLLAQNLFQEFAFFDANFSDETLCFQLDFASVADIDYDFAFSWNSSPVETVEVLDDS